MATIIPSTLHFILLGPSLRSVEIRSALLWALYNPEYAVHIWTELPLDSIVEQVQEQFALLRLGTSDDEEEDADAGDKSQQDSQASAQPATDSGEEGDAETTDDAAASLSASGDDPAEAGESPDAHGDEEEQQEDIFASASASAAQQDDGDEGEDTEEPEDSEQNVGQRYVPLQLASGDSLQITINDLETIPEITVHGGVQQMIYTLSEHVAVISALQLAVLHNEGGIYIDTAMTPNRDALPTEVIAPYGLLFHDMGLMDMPVNAVVAAPAGNSALLMLMAEIFLQKHLMPHDNLQKRTCRTYLQHVEATRGATAVATAVVATGQMSQLRCQERNGHATMTLDAQFSAVDTEMWGARDVPVEWHPNTFYDHNYQRLGGNFWLDTSLQSSALYLFQYVTGYTPTLRESASIDE
ncbi:MAG: hypothetical protein MI749_02365 [Desulfovibrionales bacterium]|nr:hypothetical protein [Desulfovibrionales bacterium]